MRENIDDVNRPPTAMRSSEHPMILAGDVGGTKTLLGLFDTATPRPGPLAARAFVTTAFPDLTAVVRAFVEAEPRCTGQVHAACFGVAGPVLGDTDELTNVPFTVDAPEIGRRFGGRDHTTVLHAVRKISSERQTVNELNQQLHVLEQTLKG